MNPAQRRRAKVASAAKAFLVAAAAILIVWEAIDGDLTGAVVAVGVLLGAVIGRGLPFVALAVAAGSQQWIAVAISAVDGLFELYERYVVPRGRPDRLDPSKLAGVVSTLPRELVEKLDEAAGRDGVVDTPLIVLCAIHDDPTRWTSLEATGVPSRRGSEGGLVVGNWTLCAAEAALVATFLDAVVSIHELAVAAMTIPNAACGRSAKGMMAAIGASGYSQHRLAHAMAQAAAEPAGQLLLTRVGQGKGKSTDHARAELPEARWIELRGSFEVAPPRVAEARRRAAPLSRPAQPATPRLALRRGPTRPASKSPPPSNAAATRRKQSRSARVPWDRARAEWPLAALLAWWVLRPGCTLTALALSVIGLVGDRPVAAGGCLAIALLIRPTRSVWLGCAAAALAWWLAAPIGVLVAARVVAGTVTLLLVGPGWRAGTQSLVALRRKLSGSSGLDEAWNRLETKLTTVDEKQYLEDAAAVVLAAWSTASFPIMITTSMRVARGVTLGRWPFRTLPRFGDAFLRLTLIEDVAERSIRMLTWLATFLVVWLAVPGNGHTVFGFHVYGWIVAIAAAWFCARLGARGPIRKRIPSCVLLALLTILLSGRQAAFCLGIAAAVALTGMAIRQRGQVALIAGRPRPPRRLGGIRSLGVRDQWVAACGALSDNHTQIARQLWRRIAQDERLVTPVRAAAFAALADLSAGAGDLQTALDDASQAVTLAGSSRQACGTVYATAGRISLAAGDAARAQQLLSDRAVSRRDRRDPRYMAARVELDALGQDPDVALAQLESGSVALLRSRRLVELITLEVTVLSRIAETAATEPVERRLRSLIAFDFGGTDAPDAARERLTAALARARILLGRLQLQRGASREAAFNLRRAVADLDSPRETMERANARIMLGAAVAADNRTEALQQISVGISQMEQSRGELRAGLHRSQLVARYAPVYERALETLMLLQHDNSEAGFLAAQLCESLCRSALAQTLRRSDLGISQAGRELLGSIASLEAEEGERDDYRLAELREQLKLSLSDTFATAYLPGTVDFRQLRHRLGAAHALSYRVHAATSTVLRGHVVWTMPRGAAPVVAAFSIDAPSMLAVLGLRGPEERDAYMARFSIGSATTVWRDLGAALLPAGLRGVLRHASREAPEHVVIVPDGPLTLLPWAAVTLDDDRFLTEAASLQFVPTLDLLDEAPGSSQGSREQLSDGAIDHVASRVIVYSDPAFRASRELQLIERFHDVAAVTSVEQFCSSLASLGLAGAYIAAHGDGSGLEQHVTFTGSGRLSAASALGYPWPEWTIFASCLVGGLRYELGEDPLGLPVSCLIGGARSVIGGVMTINDATGGYIASGVAVRLTSRVHPAEALRGAQLSFLGNPRRSPEPRRWAGFVCLSRAVPSWCHQQVPARHGLVDDEARHRQLMDVSGPAPGEPQ